MKAFPTDQFFVTPHGTLNQVKGIQEGMDLRDYFAAKAMQSLLLMQKRYEDNSISLAIHSYMIADAMMKAREQ